MFLTSHWPSLELGRSRVRGQIIRALGTCTLFLCCQLWRTLSTLSSTPARELTRESQPQHRLRMVFVNSFTGPWALHIVNGMPGAWIMRLAVPITTPPCTFSLRPVTSPFGSSGEAHWVCKSGSWVQNFNTRISLLPGADLLGLFWIRFRGMI